MLRALLLAPPGAGKGTQGRLLAERYTVPHLATGEMLRAEVASGTDIGQQAKVAMDGGALVPDEFVVRLVVDRISAPGAVDGFILDGFPRSLSQAEAAFEWGQRHNRAFHVVIALSVPDVELATRLIARGAVEGRTDDNEATIRRRLDVYRSSTQPLLDYYTERGILVELDGIGTVDDVCTRISVALADRHLGPQDLSSQ